MGASVQFYGMESVMQASESRKCPCWGIYVNGGLFSKYEDTDIGTSMDMLQQNLEVLQKSNANAIYTLKFFECVNDKPVKINDRSICDGGRFNFKLIEEEERMNGVMRVGSYSNEIKELREEINRLKQETEVEPEPETIGSVMLDLIKKPEELAQVVNIGRMLLGYPVQNMAAMGSIRTPAAIEQISEDQKLQRLAKSMDILETHDPLLITHLEKLAKMAENNPDQFKATVSMLDIT